MKLILLSICFFSTYTGLMAQQKVSRISKEFRDGKVSTHQEYDRNDNLIYEKSDIHYPGGDMSSRLNVSFYNDSSELIMRFEATDGMQMITMLTFEGVEGESKRRYISSVYTFGEDEPAVDILKRYYMDKKLVEITTDFKFGSKRLELESFYDEEGRDAKRILFVGSDTGIVEVFQHYPDSSLSVQYHYVNNKRSWSNHIRYNENGDDLSFYQIEKDGDTSYASVYSYDIDGNLIKEISSYNTINYTYSFHDESEQFICLKEVHIHKGEISRIVTFEYNSRGDLVRSRVDAKEFDKVYYVNWRHQYFKVE